VIGRQPASPRIARAIVNGASTPVAMINRNAMPCTRRARWPGYRPSAGTSTRNPAKISATPSRASSTTAKLLARLRGS
jgi:hypothetical protein